MKDSKMIKMIKDHFKNEDIDDECIEILLNTIKEKKLKPEKEILDYFEWLKEDWNERTIDDSEFDEDI